MRREARTVVPVVVLAALAALVGGCAADPGGRGKDDVAAGGASKAGGAPASATGAGTRGTTTAALGEPVTVTDEAGTAIIELTVEAITPDRPCDGDETARPANGHFLGVAMTLSASPALAGYDHPFGAWILQSSGRFTVVGPDGVPETAAVVGGIAATACSGEFNLLLSRTVEPGRTYRGVVVLDSAHAEGTLVWQPVLADLQPGPGWEWTF